MSKNRIILTASSNIGIGLWTSICMSFASIFGVFSQSLWKKQDLLISDLIAKIYQEIDDKAKYYMPVAIDVWFNGHFNASMSVVLEKQDKKYKTLIKHENSNTGIGLWTSICKCFSNIAGIKSKRFDEKMRFVLDNVTIHENKNLVQCVLRKPSSLNAVMVRLICLDYVEPQTKEENNNQTTKPVIKEETINEQRNVKENPVDDMSLFKGTSITIAEDFSDYGLNFKKGMKGIIDSISDESDLVSVHMTDKIKGYCIINKKYLKKDISKTNK